MTTTTLSRESKILVIDDDRHITSIVKFYLEERGAFHVFEENFSERAIETAMSFQPDLILLDWNMPVLNGAGVVRLLEDDPDLRDVPIVFITSYGDRARKFGFPVLEKPFVLSALQECVERILAPQTAAACAE